MCGRRIIGLVFRPICTIAKTQQILVVPSAAFKIIAIACAAGEDIIPFAAGDDIDAITPFEPVRSFAAPDKVITVPTIDVVSVATERSLIERANVNLVIAIAAKQPVIQTTAVKRVIASPAKNVIAKV